GSIEEGRELLTIAIGRHLRSDVPLGVFLSSGLDSTAIAGFAQTAASGEIHAFTVSFPDDPSFDEIAVARKAADRVGTAHHEIPVDHGTALAWAEDGLYAMDQPALDGLNTYVVSRAARTAGLTVAVSGLGGDEMFAGYSSFREVPRWRGLARMTSPIPSPLRAVIASVAAAKRGPTAQSKARDIARSSGSLTHLYLHYRRALSNGSLRTLGLIPKEIGLDDSYLPPGAGVDGCEVADDPVATIGRLESAFYLRNTLLRDSDVFGMANSLEIRVPFLDRAAVEWAGSLLGEAVLPEGKPLKHLLRLIASDFYSEEQQAQPKKGFVLPLANWIEGPLKEFVHDGTAALKSAGVVEPGAVDDIKKNLENRPHSSAWSRLWTLAALGHWLGNAKSRAAT
ncbi:MAG: asparagine synthase C-terminal domain-containing protein, partial [Actinomycetota bacterium]|nr:asparagine synthase C-terminal domain-containing protein [Actinomycetota bacterium]